MKHVILTTAFLLGVQLLYAQAILLDSSFAQNGHLSTHLYSGMQFGTYLDVTPDQQLVLAGSSRIGQQMYFSLKKYSTSGDSLGGLFLPVNSGSYIDCTAMKMTADGGYIIADWGSKSGLKKINPDGLLDSTFGTGGNASLFHNSINEILITQDNRILAAGENLNNVMGVLKGGYVIAYDLNGQLDSTFADHGKFRYLLDDVTFFNRIQELPDGKILVSGCSLSPSSGLFHTLIKLWPNGVRDSTFGVDGVVEDLSIGMGENYGLMIQPDQKIVVCGYVSDPYRAFVARYLPNGSLDPAFGVNGAVYIPELQDAMDVMILPNGKLLVYALLSGTPHRNALIQLLPDGSRDPYFGTNGVFFSPLTKFYPPMKMKRMNENKIIATGEISFYTSTSVSSYLQLQGFILDLNVGVVEPGNPPSAWVYPNPVHRAFEMAFRLETAQQVQIDLYNVQGNLVQNILTNEPFDPGDHKIPVALRDDLPAGGYLLTLSSSGKPVVTVQVLKN